jgi:hypothetical protein
MEWVAQKARDCAVEMRGAPRAVILRVLDGLF